MPSPAASNGRIRVLIMGAAGRDFHNFNVYFRGNDTYEVVAFTAAQIPNIDDRRYPAELAGDLYPDGIEIHPEEDLEELIQERRVQQVVFAYSDVSHVYLMHIGSRVNAAGADFRLMGADSTMVASSKPVVSVCAVRTGSGKSQTTRRVVKILKSMDQRLVVIRHPMPYGDLVAQKVQRFATLEDLDKHDCTIEEREEYEPHIQAGNLVFAGIDYARILAAAEQEAEVILWDGGNNDMPFYRPDLFLCVADPHRPGHELRYHPGETNLRMANLVVLNKMDTADPADVETVRRNIAMANPGALIVECDSPLTIEDAGGAAAENAIRGQRVLCVEDGPTVTHGEMPYGAAHVAARRHGAALIADPRPHAAGSIRATFEKYPHCREVLPAMGYGEAQMRELERTIDAVDCDLVLVGTPIDLARTLKINKPALRVRYELREREPGQIETAIRRVLT
ncbi:MAG TPA: cyclic 2,3-diphosphoglycerate synthase [Acidobacteriota bacterium]